MVRNSDRTDDAVYCSMKIECHYCSNESENRYPFLACFIGVFHTPIRHHIFYHPTPSSQCCKINGDGPKEEPLFLKDVLMHLVKLLNILNHVNFY